MLFHNELAGDLTVALHKWIYRSPSDVRWPSCLVKMIIVSSRGQLGILSVCPAMLRRAGWASEELLAGWLTG